MYTTTNWPDLRPTAILPFGEASRDSCGTPHKEKDEKEVLEGPSDRDPKGVLVVYPGESFVAPKTLYPGHYRVFVKDAKMQIVKVVLNGRVMSKDSYRVVSTKKGYKNPKFYIEFIEQIEPGDTVEFRA